MTKYVQVPLELLEQLREQVRVVDNHVRFEDEPANEMQVTDLDLLHDRAGALVDWVDPDWPLVGGAPVWQKAWNDWVVKFESALPPEWWELTQSAVAYGYGAGGREALDEAAEIFAQYVRDHEGAMLPDYGRGRKDAYAHAEKELRDRSNGLK